MYDEFRASNHKEYLLYRRGRLGPFNSKDHELWREWYRRFNMWADKHFYCLQMYVLAHDPVCVAITGRRPLSRHGVDRVYQWCKAASSELGVDNASVEFVIEDGMFFLREADREGIRMRWRPVGPSYNAFEPPPS